MNFFKTYLPILAIKEQEQIVGELTKVSNIVFEKEIFYLQLPLLDAHMNLLSKAKYHQFQLEFFYKVLYMFLH